MTASRDWVVELDDGEKQIVHAVKLWREEGFLCAGDGENAEAMWAPDIWARFFPRAEQDQVDRLAVTVQLFCEELIERAATDDERERLAVYLAEAKVDLEQAVARRGGR